MEYLVAAAEVTPLDILLVVLVCAAVWAVVELALTIRKARSAVDDITRSANETIEQVQPIINKIDGAVDDLQPAIKEVAPLVEKAQSAVDVATVDLARVNDVLSDVSEVSGTAANVTTAVNRVADSATAGVSNVIGRLTGKGKHQAPKAHLADTSTAPAEHAVAAPEEEPAGEGGYVVYGADGAKAEEASGSPNDEAAEK